jgi:hypothetical protein
MCLHECFCCTICSFGFLSSCHEDVNVHELFDMMIFSFEIVAILSSLEHCSIGSEGSGVFPSSSSKLVTRIHLLKSKLCVPILNSTVFVPQLLIISICGLIVISRSE